MKLNNLLALPFIAIGGIVLAIAWQIEGEEAESFKEYIKRMGGL